MPRNISGTYTLPLPPVVPNTTIESAWANQTLDDIAQALTDSLDRTGRGGLTGPFRLIDGTAPQPAWAFNAETSTGMYRAAPGNLAVSIMGVQVGSWAANGYSGKIASIEGPTTIAGNVTVTGSVITAGVANSGDMSVAGTSTFDGPIVSNNLVTLNFGARFADGAQAAPSLSFTAQPDLGIYRGGASLLRFVAGNSLMVDWTLVNSANLALYSKNGFADSVLNLCGGSAADTNKSFLQLLGRNGGSYIQTLGGGSTPRGPINYIADAHNFSGGTVSAPVFALASGNMSLSSDAGHSYLSFAPNWFFSWEIATGNLAYIRNSGTGPTTTFLATGDFYAGKDIYTGDGTQLALQSNASDRVLRFTSDNWRLRWNGGNVYYENNGGGIVFSVDASGNFLSAGKFQTTGQFGLHFSNASLQPQYVALGNPANFGQMEISFVHVAGQYAGVRFVVPPGNEFRFLNDGNAFKPVAGPWTAISDSRIKRDIVDYTTGLAAILALRPVEFSFRAETHHDEGLIPVPNRHIGLLGQEAKLAMPETVTMRSHETIGDLELDDVHVLDIGPVTFALINAVKEIAARLTAAGI